MGRRKCPSNAGDSLQAENLLPLVKDFKELFELFRVDLIMLLSKKNQVFVEKKVAIFVGNVSPRWCLLMAEWPE